MQLCTFLKIYFGKLKHVFFFFICNVSGAVMVLTLA